VYVDNKIGLANFFLAKKNDIPSSEEEETRIGYV